MKVDSMREAQPIMPLKPVYRGEAGVSERDSSLPKNQDKLLQEEKKESMPVEKAVVLLNETMKSYNTELEFTLHKDSGEYIVKIINTNDHTVVREIPPERVLDMVAHFKKMLGIIVDKFI